MEQQTSLLISQIRLDGATQPRAQLNDEVIEEYSQAMRAGAAFPPVDVFYDGTDYWLADGFHRVHAAGGAELDRIAVTIHQDTQGQAKWFSFGVNKDHGLRRNSNDVKRIIQEALQHENAAQMSDNALAKHIGCSHSWVSELHRAIIALRKDGVGEKRKVTRAGKTYEQNTENIGKRKESKEPAAPVEAGTEPVYHTNEVPTVPATREKAPARTYHPDRSQGTNPEEIGQENPEEAPLVGIEGALNLITAARTISRVRLGDRDYDYLSVDIPGLRLLQDAVEILAETILNAQKFTEAEGEPVERRVIH